MTAVRQIRPDDAERWLEMRHALFSDTREAHARDIADFFAGRADEPQGVLVAEREGRLVGLAELSIRPYAEGCSSRRVGYLEGWYVDPELRKSGVGRALIEASEDWAREQGCTEFASDAQEDNELSRLAHLACGFEDMGLVRCFRKSLGAESQPKAKPANQLMVITPYWYEGTWVFDDERVDLVREPFVEGVPEVIDEMVADIPDARSGFRLLFSAAPFPNAQVELHRVREEIGGWWYRLADRDHEGWLCPALFKYFDEAPERLHAKAEPRDRAPAGEETT